MKLKTVISLSFIIIAVAIISCKSSKVSKTDIKPDDCIAMVYTDLPLNQIETDDYTIDSLFIIHDCLNVWASYSGGCGFSDFQLYFTNTIQESMPPQTTLKLKLIDKDNCRSIVQEKLYFNLSFFRDYAEKDGIEIHLGKKSVLYKK